MFVSVEVMLARSDDVLIIPAAAILFAPHGASIFVVEEDPAAGSDALVLRQQPIQLGARRGDFVVVTQGLKGGERIVATGAFKLRPGTQVVIDNRLTPEFSLTPKPGEG
jgi:membrane fusion protein (multidrug efflux system)